MHALATPAGYPGVPSRAVAALVAATAGLVAAFVVVPPRLAASGSAGDLAERGQLVAAYHTALVGYWRSGDRGYPPSLQRVVDYWFRFHLIKGGIAVLLLMVLGALTALLWRTFLRADGLGPGRRAGLVSAGAAVAMLTLGALAVVMANIQGAISPFASLLPFLLEGTSDVSLAGTLAQARQQLAGSHRVSGYASPALDAMVGDFARYHAGLAVVAALAVVVLLGLSVMCWRRIAAAGGVDRRTRRVWGWFGVCSVLSSLVLAVLLVANVGTATDPAPALLGLFNGGL